MRESQLSGNLSFFGSAFAAKVADLSQADRDVRLKPSRSLLAVAGAHGFAIYPFYQ